MRQAIRLPTLYPMPRDMGQYRVCYEEALKEPSQEAYQTHLTQRLLTEAGNPYSDDMIKKIVGSLAKTAFVRRESGVILPPDRATYRWDGTWDGSKGGFATYVGETILKWGNTFPDGLPVVYDIMGSLADSPRTAAEVLEDLTDTDGTGKYDGEDRHAGRTIREIVKLLEFAGWVERDGRAFRLTQLGGRMRTEVRKRDTYYRVEEVLTTVDPVATQIFTRDEKAALSKVYMYRECGGKYRGAEIIGRAHRILFKYPYHYKLKDEIRTELDAEDQKVKRLRDEIRDLDNAFGDLVENLGNRTKLESVREALAAGNRQRAHNLIQQSGGHFSWEGALRLRHGGPDYTVAPDISPYTWQERALGEWKNQDRKGVLEVVTGAGKTVFALIGIADLIDEQPDLRVTVLVPTKVLMYQWATELVRVLGVPRRDIGLRGDGHKDSFAAGKRVMVAIINSAIQDNFLRRDVEDLPSGTPHLLVADECHRYHGEKFRAAFETRITYGLGLSATPRDSQKGKASETRGDDDVILEALGPIFFTYSYREALSDEIIQPFIVKYVGVELTAGERTVYDAYTKKIRKSMERIRGRYGPRLEAMSGPIYARLHSILNTDEDPDPAIARFFTAVRERKEMVFRARNRKWSYLDLARRHTVEQDPDEGRDKIIVFHERIEDLEEIVAPIDYRRADQDQDPDAGIVYKKYEDDPEEQRVDDNLERLFFKSGFRPVMYHSGHTRRAWNEIGMEWFRADVANVMLSVKALVEGVDVPAANVGIIRSSSSSVRQRIQTTGRILRRASGKDRPAILYVIYVRDTTDERIFRGVDWSEQLGDAAIESYHWHEPENEDAIRGRLEDLQGQLPEVEEYEQDDDYEDFDVEDLNVGDPYPGRYAGTEYHVDAKGRPFRKSRHGRQFIANPEVKQAAERIWEWKRGGKFVITPERHLITKLDDNDLVFVGTVPDPLSFESSDGGWRGKLRSDQPLSFEDLFG